MPDDKRIISISDEDIAAELEGITLEALAVQMGRLNRFGGAGCVCYSVLQHSIVVGRFVEWLGGEHPRVALAGYLHDAGEPFVGETLRLVKTPWQAAYESRVHQALMVRLSLPVTLPPLAEDVVRGVDDRVAEAEARVLGIVKPGLTGEEPHPELLRLTEKWLLIDKGWQRDFRPYAEQFWCEKVRALAWNKWRSRLRSMPVKGAAAQRTDNGGKAHD